MDRPRNRLTRRALLAGIGAVALAGRSAAAAAGSTIERIIPASGERLPAIGMGSWITFDVGGNRAAENVRVEVLRRFFAGGGAVVDSSPMYGSSEAVIGYCLSRLGAPGSLFSASKVWTPGRLLGIGQMRHSQALWGIDGFDLMQVHNLVDWQTHLPVLAEAKQDGRLRYVGVTTSHGRRHGEVLRIMRDRPIDFVQFTYNILDREAERRLLPLAADRGLAVIVNRPFRRGALFDLFARHPLPAWAAEFDAANWAQFFLKFILSHPAVTCAIPATSRVDHMAENIGALRGRLPDATLRQRMIRYVESL